MTASGFARSLPPVLVYEGGKVDDPRDPGGRTNQGIIQRVYNAWRKAHGQPPDDVYNMTDAERDAIYRTQFWDAVQGDKLPDGIDFVVFDGAVNSGPIQSIKWLQRALGVDADGQIGAVTLAKLDAVQPSSRAALVDAIVDRREAFLKQLKTFKTFGRGWLSRTAKVRQLGRMWAGGGVPTTMVTPPVHAAPSPKAEAVDVAKPPNPGVADAATGAGVGAGALGGTIQTLQDQLTPFSMAGGWISKLVIALIILGAVLTIGGLAYRWWASRKKAVVADALDTPTVSA